MRRALQGPGVLADADNALAGYWLGPGNTNPRVDGLVGTRYTTLPVLPSCTHPGYPPAAPTRVRYYRTRHTCCTAVFGVAKEILGVDNAH